MDKIKEINELIKKYSESGLISSKDVSDTHHTFRELYQQRLVMFCTLCNLFPNLSWKSRKHFDEENDPMFNGDFIAGINTPNGTSTYHIKLEYWDLFEVPEIDRAPKYDGYTANDVTSRILSLSKIKIKDKKNIL